MKAPRYITQGRNSWSTRSGYTYAPRNDGARFERPSGDLSLFEGTLTLCLIVLVATLLIVGLS